DRLDDPALALLPTDDCACLHGGPGPILVHAENVPDHQLLPPVQDQPGSGRQVDRLVPQRRGVVRNPTKPRFLPTEPHALRQARPASRRQRRGPGQQPPPPPSQREAARSPAWAPRAASSARPEPGYPPCRTGSCTHADAWPTAPRPSPPPTGPGSPPEKP